MSKEGEQALLRAKQTLKHYLVRLNPAVTFNSDSYAEIEQLCDDLIQAAVEAAKEAMEVSK